MGTGADTGALAGPVGPSAETPRGAQGPGRLVARASVRRGLLGLILLGAALLRAWGLLHGLPEGFVYHQDAQLLVHDVWAHHLGARWREGRFGPAYGALVLASLRALDGVARFLGAPLAWSFPLVAVAASVVSAVAGTLTVWLVYFVGARAYGEAAGLLGAALVAVSPVLVLHAHYPYRDTPMLPLLLLALLGCLALAEQPTASAALLSAFGGFGAVALKTTGLLIVVPMLAAALLAARRSALLVGAGVLAAALAGVAFGTLPAIWGLPPPDLTSPVGVLRGVARFVSAYLGHFLPTLPAGLGVAARVLARALGPVGLVAGLAGLVWALRRRTRQDLVLLPYVAAGFLVPAMFPWLDERYLLPLVLVLTLLAARLAAEAWAQGGWVGFRVLVVLGLGGWLALGLAQSAWQGRLLALPDTRALGGRWAEAHLPRTARVVTEPYYPLGLDRWPRASFLDPRAPVTAEVGRADVLVTSSLEHQRYQDAPARYPAEARFFRDLDRQTWVVKSVALAPLGFAHPTITFRVPRRAGGTPEPTGPRDPVPAPLRLALPRPFDAAWAAGVSVLDGGPYDRDERTHLLRGAEERRLVLVSPRPVEELAVFAAARGQPVRLTVAVDGRRRGRTLGPGVLDVVRLRPSTWSLFAPALHDVRLAFLSPGGSALVQVRAGPREIGETAAAWGRWDEAVAALERAVQANPRDPETRWLLVLAYHQAGDPAAARGALAALRLEAPAAIEGTRRLADPSLPEPAWVQGFRALTGLDAGLLRHALGVTLEAAALAAAGTAVVLDPEATGGRLVRVRGGEAGPRVLLDGPDDLYLAPGSYVALVSLRSGEPASMRPTARIRVFAESRPLVTVTVAGRDLAGVGRGFVEVPVPFTHARADERVALRVEALGGELMGDRVRLEPDLRAFFRQRAALAEAVEGGRP